MWRVKGGSWDILLGLSSLHSTRGLPHAVLPQQAEDVSPAPCRPAHGPLLLAPRSRGSSGARRVPPGRGMEPRGRGAQPGLSQSRHGPGRAAARAGRKGGREEEEEALCGRKRGCCSWPAAPRQRGAPRRAEHPLGARSGPGGGGSPGTRSPVPSRGLGQRPRPPPGSAAEGKAGREGREGLGSRRPLPSRPVPSPPFPSRSLPSPPRADKGSGPEAVPAVPGPPAPPGGSLPLPRSAPPPVPGPTGAPLRYPQPSQTRPGVPAAARVGAEPGPAAQRLPVLSPPRKRSAGAVGAGPVRAAWTPRGRVPPVPRHSLWTEPAGPREPPRPGAAPSRRGGLAVAGSARPGPPGAAPRRSSGRRRSDGGRRRRLRGGQGRRRLRPGPLRAAAAGPGADRQRGESGPGGGTARNGPDQHGTAFPFPSPSFPGPCPPPLPSPPLSPLTGGYTNRPNSGELFCIFNHNEDACRYGIGIGVLAFLACIFFFVVDVYFPQISNATDRKYLVLADLGFSGTGAPGQGRASRNGRPRPVTWPPLGAWQRELLLARCLQATRCQPELLCGAGAGGQAGSSRAVLPAAGDPRGAGGRSPCHSRRLPPAGLWTFLWFVGFCFLTNQWAWTQAQDVLIGADSARAVITFSFFSIFSWGLLIAFAYKRYKMGVEDFAHSYVDPTPEVSTPYSSYPNISHDSYQQPPFTQTAEATEGYQPPPVY
ncbi:Synaptogyrin-2 [Aix galericulata]|nr:Synaptogyrin-2 [Aix galericulata]